ncbi:MAG: thioredoxin domain-containing protein [Bryobacteraceae bacterium]
MARGVPRRRMTVTTVVSYEDLQCPDCAIYRRMVDNDLRERFGANVAFEHRDFPLAKHDWARAAAVASRYFYFIDAELGNQFRAYCYKGQPGISKANFEEKLFEFGTSHGLQSHVLNAALQDEASIQAVERDYQEGVARGVERTPTVFVNAQMLVEKFTAEELSKAIEKA